MLGDTVLETVHGSHLYGLAHAKSDVDIYRVVWGSAKPTQTIHEGVDTYVIGWPQFMAQCERGVPQALEALYSRNKHVDVLPYMSANFFAHGPQVRARYNRTVRNFWQEGSFKRRRHAWRLWFDYRDLERHGRFDPRMTPFQRRWSTWAARVHVRPPYAPASKFDERS